jgi:hypothetical protein
LRGRSNESEVIWALYVINLTRERLKREAASMIAFKVLKSDG